MSGFTCPRCGRVSWNPADEREGYCGACHDWTGEPAGHEHDARCARRNPAQMFAAFLADLLGRQRAADAVERAIIDYGDCLETAIGLNQRYAGRWHCWFVALAGSVEWLARPADAEPVGEPTISAWSPDELIAKIARHM